MEFTTLSKTDLSDQLLNFHGATFGLARMTAAPQNRRSCHLFRTADARRCLLADRFLFSSEQHRNLQQLDLRSGRAVAAFRRMSASVPCSGDLRGRVVLQLSSSEQAYNDYYVLYDVKRRKPLCRLPRPGNNILMTSKMNPCRDGIFVTSPHSAVVLRGSKELYSVDFSRRTRVAEVENVRSRGQFLECVVPSREDPALLYILYFDAEDRGIVGEVLGKDLPLHITAFDSRSQRQVKSCKLDRIYRPFHIVTAATVDVGGHCLLLVCNYTTAVIRMYLFDAFSHAQLFAQAQPPRSKLSSVAQGSSGAELRCLKRVSLATEESEQLRLVTQAGGELWVLTSRSLTRVALRLEEREAESSCRLV